MENTLGTFAINLEQQLTAALTTFANSDRPDFFAAFNQFNGSLPNNDFDADLNADRATFIGSNEQQKIADFIAGNSSDSLTYAAKNGVAIGTFPTQNISNSGALDRSTDPLTGMRTASQFNLYPDNSLATARNVVGVENGQVKLNEFVGVGDGEDYYRFTISRNSDLNVRLDGLSADAEVQVIQDNNRNGIVEASEVIGGSFNYDSTPEDISLLGLTPGTYYVRVFSYSNASTYYNLTLAATPGTGFSSIYGYGLVNANAAVSRTLNRPTSFPKVPNLGGNNWGRDAVNAPEVWDRGITGNGIVVAVVDSGVDYTHPDLDDNIWLNVDEIPNNGIDDDRNGYVDDIRGWDFASNDNDPMDRDIEGHGTHIAGAIAAERNDFGITGVAPNAKIMPVRVLSIDGFGAENNLADGIRYAADNGANVINFSVGSWFPLLEVDEAIKYATDKRVVVVMSAGNDGFTEPDYPAINADRFGIAVGGIDRNRRMNEFSNRAGSRPLDYLVAPGVDIFSTTPFNTYESYTGTSVAAPHVAGVAALVLQANPTLTPGQVEYILTTTANSNGITV